MSRDKSIFADPHPERKGSIDKVSVDRITIDPKLSIPELLRIIKDKPKVDLVKISFEGGMQVKNISIKTFGKSKEIKLKISENSAFIPKKTIKFSNSYRMDNFLEAFNELEDYLIKHKHDYTLDIYPISLFIVDMGGPPNFAPVMIKFGKERKIEKDSEIGTMLKGNIIMPLDAITLYKAEKNRKGHYSKKGIPSKLYERMKRYIGHYFLTADDVKNYTRNIYESEFTLRTTCIVGKETKIFDRYVPVPGGGCKIVDK